jgi:hypothetical protein
MFRPFSLADFQPIPKSWQVNGPDFVGVASAKAGTSWWYSLLLDHPEISNNRLGVKELCYFYHFGYHGIDQRSRSVYRRAFAAPKGTISGEWSPGYLSHPFCIEHLSSAAPATKLLLILRNPVDRLVSHINQIKRVRAKAFNLEPKMDYLFGIFSVYPEVFSQSLYVHSLRQMLRFFDASQILVLQYERCKLEPVEQIRKTYRFLGVKDTYVPKTTKHRVNSQVYSISKPIGKERQRLAEFFTDDVHAVAEIFPQIDLALWPDFRF